MITFPPTEHIDVSCKLAAAVAVSMLVHLLHLLPKVFVDVIPMTAGYCSCITDISSYVDELGVYCTDAKSLQFCGID